MFAGGFFYSGHRSTLVRFQMSEDVFVFWYCLVTSSVIYCLYDLYIIMGLTLMNGEKS